MSNAKKDVHLARLKENAPNRCEICDCSLPTFDERIRHIEDTGHCACSDVDCWGYIPPGAVYAHFCAMHDHEHWNDHQIASGDASTLREALPWVRVERWLGGRGGPESPALSAYLMKVKEGNEKYRIARLAARKKFVKKRDKETREGKVAEDEADAKELGQGE